MYNFSNRPPRRKFINEEPSMTIQAAAAETDINVMMARYQRTGSFHGSTQVPSVLPNYGDFSVLPDYQEALSIVMQAQDTFAALPASVRDRFGNDPTKMLNFLADDNNREEALKLGLISNSGVRQMDSDPNSAPSDS